MNRKIKRFSAGFVLCLALFSGPTRAESLDTNFYQLELPESWQVTRNATGLWVVGPTDDVSWRLTLSRLSADPELYFQAMARLWEKTGDVSLLEKESDGPNKLIAFEIAPRDGSNSILKFCRWNQDLVWVASYEFPVEQREEALEMGQRFTGNIQFLDFKFEPSALKDEIWRVLVEHGVVRPTGLGTKGTGSAGCGTATGQKLESSDFQDLTVIRTEMTSFRQDWEPYFPHSKPPLYEGFRKYLEARYDASFAINNAEQMGMPQSLLDSRITSVENRRAELLMELDGEFRWSDEGL